MSLSPDHLSCVCSSQSGCKIEAILALDDRGQVVIPKDVREKADIRAGDKLALVGWEREGKICCLTLLKVESLSDLLQETIGPLMNGRPTGDSP